MITALEWVKARWKCVAAGLAILGAFIFGFLSRKPAPQLPLPPVDGKQKEIEQQTQKQEQQAAEKRDETITVIEQQHSAVIEKLDQEQQKKYETLKDDPEALTNFLLSVGKDARS